MELVRFQCPSCGAELPPKAPAGEQVCEYCGSHFAPEGARSAKTTAGVSLDSEALDQLRKAHEALVVANQQLEVARAAEADARAQARAARRESKRQKRESSGPGFATRLVAFAGRLVFVVFILGVVAFSLIATGVLSFLDIPWLRGLDLVEELESRLADEGVDPWAGPPLLVEIAGQPALIARVREHTGEQIFVDAYTLPSEAGGELERRYRVGPLGAHSELEHARFAVAGPWLVVSSTGREVFVHDLATGARVRTVDVRRPVDYLCTIESPEPEVYIRQTKRRHDRLDVATGKTKRERKVPVGCETWRADTLDASAVSNDRVELDGELADLELELIRAHVDPDAQRGALWVRGDEGPAILGFGYQEDEAARRKRLKRNKPLSLELDAPTWQAQLPADAKTWPLDATLAEGRLLTAWVDNEGRHHVSAHTLDGGELAWTIPVGLEVGDRLIGVRGGLGHVMVIRSHSVELLDASTGASLASLGEGP